MYSVIIFFFSFFGAQIASSENPTLLPADPLLLGQLPLLLFPPLPLLLLAPLPLLFLPPPPSLLFALLDERYLVLLEVKTHAESW